MPSEAERVRNYRSYKSLLKNVEKLHEYKEINKKDKQWLVACVKRLYLKLKAEFRAKRMPSYKKRGRPRIPERNAQYPMCKKLGCTNQSAPGQAYCAREHSPFSHLLEQK